MDDQNQDLVDELAVCGLAATGDPAAVTVDVVGAAVHVTLRRDGARRLVEARVQAPGPSDPRALTIASLAAPGDTALLIDGTDLVARRTLIEPPPWLLHDVVHDLAKQLCDLRCPPEPLEGQPADPGSESWVFVDTTTPIVESGDPSTPVAVLVPGTWYQVLARDGAWVRVHHPAGADGWVQTDKVVFS